MVKMPLSLKERWKVQFVTADIETVRSWLTEDPSLVHEPVQFTLGNGSIREYGPLFAIRTRDLEKVKILIDAGAKLQNSNLGTHWPSENYDVNAYFIEKGIDVNQPSYLGFHATGVSDIDTFFLMLENGLNPNASWPYIGESLLHVQARHDDDTHINAQARSGLDDEPILHNEHFIQYGKETPLHFAARLGNMRQTRLLLKHGADPNLKTVSKKTDPPVYSPWIGQIESLMWPLKNFDRVQFEPYEGETPLDMAIRFEFNDIATVISNAT
jgi:ankyrin repeat protein